MAFDEVQNRLMSGVFNTGRTAAFRDVADVLNRPAASPAPGAPAPAAPAPAPAAAPAAAPAPAADGRATIQPVMTRPAPAPNGNTGIVPPPPPAAAPAPAPTGVLTPTPMPASANFDFTKAAGEQKGPATYTPDDNSLVSAQLAKLLSKDSPYLQAARLRATQQMNARGLTNSSMAVGAAELAATEAALPIAQGDAGVFATAQRDNTDATNVFNRDSNQFGRDTANLQYRGILDKESQASDQNFRAQQATVEFSRELEKMGYATKLSNSQLPVQFATSVASQLQSQVSSIMGDANLSPEAKQNAITNLVNYSNATMEWAERFYGGTFSRFSPTDRTAPSSTASAPAPAPAPAPARAPAPAPAMTWRPSYENVEVGGA